MLRIKEYLPSIEVLKRVHENELDIFEKKEKTLKHLTDTISDHVAATKKFR